MYINTDFSLHVIIRYISLSCYKLLSHVAIVNCHHISFEQSSSSSSSISHHHHQSIIVIVIVIVIVIIIIIIIIKIYSAPITCSGHRCSTKVT